MDALSAEAVDALVQAITALLPATTPALAPTVIAVPSRVAPTGLGGFVGTNADPEGEIFGRRIEGNILITARAGNLAGIDDAVNGAIKALLTADRKTLLDSGILHIGLDSVGPKPSASPPGSPERDISVRIVFEHLKLPTEAEGVIGEIPLNVTIG
jgi:hypothetical protein